ncbi:MAG: hypothetical protein KDI98_04285 [Hyphomicrobiaceae bacterium]|nr:hypothetical protein [Hyphomicrobiaceae bacterium]
MSGVLAPLYRERQPGALIALAALLAQLVLMLAGIASPAFGAQANGSGGFIICALTGPIDASDEGAPYTYQHCDCLLMATALVAEPPRLPTLHPVLAEGPGIEPWSFSPLDPFHRRPPATGPPSVLA